jgi:hypothetical protein
MKNRLSPPQKSSKQAGSASTSHLLLINTPVTLCWDQRFDAPSEAYRFLPPFFALGLAFDLVLAFVFGFGFGFAFALVLGAGFALDTSFALAFGFAFGCAFAFVFPAALALPPGFADPKPEPT